MNINKYILFMNRPGPCTHTGTTEFRVIRLFWVLTCQGPFHALVLKPANRSSHQLRGRPYSDEETSPPKSSVR